MDRKKLLLSRLNDIGRSLERTDHSLALIGLGSVGLELERLDEYSDLDFFVIVEAGHKVAFMQDLSWLEGVHPAATYFQNTDDGYKLLYEDGIFCEFAIFEPAELARIPFAPGRIVWKRPEVDDSLAIPSYQQSSQAEREPEWLLGEALSNLYVGLGRYRRGEKLSGTRFVEGFAVDRLLQLAALVEEETATAKDPFANERRIEERFPALARKLPSFVQGYERCPESAEAILDYLEAHFPVHPAMAREIRRLAAD